MLFFKRLSMIGAVIVVGLVSFTGSVSAAGLLVTATNGTGADIVGVMWITDGANTYQRTFGLWSKSSNRTHLTAWRAKAGTTATVDGITGATQAAGATMSATWNLNGANGTAVPVTGSSYKFFIEVSEDGPAAVHVVGHIVVDATGETVTTIDSSSTGGTSSIKNISAVFTPPSTAVNSPEVGGSIKQTAYSFTVPANYAGLATVRLISADGTIIWQKNYTASAGNRLVLNADEIKAGFQSNGVAILEADFGTSKVSRPYFMTR